MNIKKSKIIAVIVFCAAANLSYSNTLYPKTITNILELDDIFNEKTLSDIDNKDISSPNMATDKPGAAPHTIDYVRLKKQDGNVVIESITPVQVEVIPAPAPEIRNTDNDTAENSTAENSTSENTASEQHISDNNSENPENNSRYLTENDIKDYYRQRTYKEQDTDTKYKEPGNEKDIKENAPSKTKKAKKITTLYFKENLTLKNEDNVREVADYIKENNISKVKLVGHSSPSKNRIKNAELSVKRADEVRQKLVKLGIEKSRIAINGRGDLEPKSSKNPELNKRVEIEYIK